MTDDILDSPAQRSNTSNSLHEISSTGHGILPYFANDDIVLT